MDTYHEVFQKHVRSLEAQLEDAHETIADLELDAQEKDELIANMARDLRRLRADRELSVIETILPDTSEVA